MVIGVVDCSYLCHRAFHATGPLSHKGVDTSVIFGFLRDLKHLVPKLNADQMAFCFDHPHNHRTKLYPDYKANRGQNAKLAQEYEERSFQWQVWCLRTEVLPALGYANIYRQSGFEADDLIAATVADPCHQFKIVTEDHDFYQLLGPRVCLYKPRKGEFYSELDLRLEWGVSPAEWKFVMAVVGCSTDNIPGIPGVGHKTACQYLRGELTKGAKHQKIEEFIGTPNFIANRYLTELPFHHGGKGVSVALNLTPQEENTGWAEVCERFGLSSLMDNHAARTRGRNAKKLQGK